MKIQKSSLLFFITFLYPPKKSWATWGNLKMSLPDTIIQKFGFLKVRQVFFILVLDYQSKLAEMSIVFFLSECEALYLALLLVAHVVNDQT